MSRDFQINGETVVRTKFGAHLPSSISNYSPPGATSPSSNLSELGLASEGIRITPRFVHKDINVDDFGPEIPAEVMWLLADVNIRMTLIHYDVSILDFCLSESMGGTFLGGAPGLFDFAGIMQPAGSFLGNYVPYLLSGYHYTSLNLTSPALNFPWHFPAAYLTGPPIELPLGTQASMVELNWRAIPYVVPMISVPTIIVIPSAGIGVGTFINVGPAVSVVNFKGEIFSSGVVLWNHLIDVT